MKRTIFLPTTLTTFLLLSCGLIQTGNTLVVAEGPKAREETEEPTEGFAPVPGMDGNGEKARTHLEALTAIGGRPPGSSNERQAADYIQTVFTETGYQPEIREFSAGGKESQNVAAVKTGSSAREIIIGAHYDSADEGVGTDDNASGTAVLLETAENIFDRQIPYTIRFITFGSEESGLEGSRHYAGRMTDEDVSNTLAMINLDSLAAGNLLYVYSDEGEDAFLRDWILGWAEEHGYPLETIRNADLTSGGYYFSDFGSFKDKGIPFIYFEATDWTLGKKDGWTQVDPRYGENGYIWHTPFDNLEYLDATFPGRVNEHLNIFVSLLMAITTEFTE